MRDTNEEVMMHKIALIGIAGMKPAGKTIIRNKAKSREVIK